MSRKFAQTVKRQVSKKSQLQRRERKYFNKKIRPDSKVQTLGELNRAWRIANAVRMTFEKKEREEKPIHFQKNLVGVIFNRKCVNISLQP